jgi:hypothetical protein
MKKTKHENDDLERCDDDLDDVLRPAVAELSEDASLSTLELVMVFDSFVERL